MRRLIYNYRTDKLREDFSNEELSVDEEDVSGVDEFEEMAR